MSPHEVWMTTIGDNSATSSLGRVAGRRERWRAACGGAVAREELVVGFSAAGWHPGSSEPISSSALRSANRNKEFEPPRKLGAVRPDESVIHDMTENAS